MNIKVGASEESQLTRESYVIEADDKSDEKSRTAAKKPDTKKPK